MILNLLRRRGVDDAADSLYARAVEAARTPAFYESFGVPDSVEGRFELVMLHTGLLVTSAKGRSAEGAQLARRLSEVFFADMDRNLREMGVGDLSIGKRMQKIASAFYGRSEAYREALEQPGDARLAEAILRNVFSGEPAGAVDQLVAHVRATARIIDATPEKDLLAGRLPPLPPPVWNPAEGAA